MEKTIFIEDIGEVRLWKSSRARRVSIRITPGGQVTVTIPAHSGWNAALRFLEQKKKWVKKTLVRLEEKRPPRRVYHPGENPFTRRHRLFLLPDSKISEKVQARISGGKITVTYPAAWPLSHPLLQEMISSLRIRALRNEARVYLPGRLTELAGRYGYTYRRLFLKNLKSRWGSCSSAGNINLNIRLMDLPDHLIDYVILHELAHTRHKNHGPAFWAELEMTTGNARKLDKELNRYHIFQDL